MDKAYIVANKEQELEVLKKFEQDGFVWINGGEKPTEWLPSEKVFSLYTFDFPYTITSSDDGDISWFPTEELEDETIVYDGRKEDEEVDTRYKVTQEFMSELIGWRDKKNLDATGGDSITYVGPLELGSTPEVIREWRLEYENPIERNNRLITILQWLNGEEVFEVEEPHKFVVRSDKSYTDGNYAYVIVDNGVSGKSYYDVSLATKFDTREEAQEWANSHQVVIEIDEEGNEVE